jgi:hypothetical protein
MQAQDSDQDDKQCDNHRKHEADEKGREEDRADKRHASPTARANQRFFRDLMPAIGARPEQFRSFSRCRLAHFFVRWGNRQRWRRRGNWQRQCRHLLAVRALDRPSAKLGWIFDVAATVLTLRVEVCDCWHQV